MALQAISGGLWIPSLIPVTYSTSAATYVIDASGEKAVLVFRCPKAGSIDRFDFNVGTVTNSPDNGLRASLQGVSATTAQNDGTILGATNNAKVTYAHTVTTGWKSTNFGEVAVVTKGQLVAAVIDFPTFVAGDSVTLNRFNTGSGGAQGLPYGLSDTGTAQPTNLPLFAIHYTDGYVMVSPNLPGCDGLTSVSYNSGTATLDEYGLAFSLPFPAQLSEVCAYIGFLNAGANFDVVVYDAADVAQVTVSCDVDNFPSAAPGWIQVPLTTDVTLAANTVYRATIRPTTTNSLSFNYMTFQSAALLGTLEGGTAFYMTGRLNQAGAWTNYNTGTFRRPLMSLLFTAFDDAVSAGGALLRPVGMTGNLVYA